MSYPTVNKRRTLSIADKLFILRKHDENTTLKQCELAKLLDIPGSTLRTILKSRREIEMKAQCNGTNIKRQKVRSGKFDELEKILVQWFHLGRAMNITLNEQALQDKAQEIAQTLGLEEFFNNFYGWIHEFRQRNGIVLKERQSEFESPILDHIILPPLVRGYGPQDIYNAAEFGLFYNLMPDYVFTEKNDYSEDNDRMTVLICVNSDGSDKLPPLIIGESKKFNNIKSFPCNYDVLHNSWMTEARFVEWLTELDDLMIQQQRRILLLVDNSSIHTKNVQLSNIQIEYLTENSISCPMNFGIIRAVKEKYRRRVLQHRLQMMEDPTRKPINMLDALHYLSAAWFEISEETIRNSFKNAYLYKEPEDEAIIDDEEWELIKGQFADFEHFVTFDDNLGTNPDDSDSVITIKDDTDEEDTPIPPSKREALSAINTLRHYLSSLPNVTLNVFEHVNSTESVVLSSIQEHFES